MASITFIRRTAKEVEIFGGNVFIDLNGKNIATLGYQDYSINLPAGTHTIKMYKSHTFDTFIGFAESTLNIGENDNLLIQYAPPMVVSQPGNMIVRDNAERISVEREQTLSSEYNRVESEKAERDRKTNNGIVVFIVIAVITAIIWGVYEAKLFSSIY